MTHEQKMGALRHLTSILGVLLVAHNPKLAGVYDPELMANALVQIAGGAIIAVSFIASLFAPEKRK